ncbi:MAG TPA: DNA-directed RNA polymerase subunit beta' [Patescibacteria group bacterium]|nr:DNA-directed RNA polymerase subunit beta' [Patescibacteria group bacterium]
MAKISELLDFDGLKIKLASPEKILEWSHGEVTKPETINYRTLKPEKDGLFDERIFGPVKDWECYCGKYKRIRHRGIICDKCGVEVTQSRVRRERMGHIKLASPVAHVWFFKGAPSKLSLLLDISSRHLESVIYFAKYLITAVDKEKQAEIIKTLQQKLDEKKKSLKEAYDQKEKDLQKTLNDGKKSLSKKVKEKEGRELAVEEIELKHKQRLMIVKDEFLSEQDRADEVFKTIETLVKGSRPLGLLSEEEFFKLSEYDATSFLTLEMGAQAIVKVLQQLDVDKIAATLREEVQSAKGQKYIKATKRLRIAESLRKAEIRPEWMVLSVLPVIPPDLRPMVQLSGGRFATSDLNDLYRRVINRNNRLRHLMDLGAPEVILRNEKRMLQEAVDALIDSVQRIGVRRRGRELRSLSDMLKGKQGRFRQNLLGKRVDYSGRSVIVVGPHLKLDQCGLPKEMALEMFRPFVLRELIMRGFAPNIKSAKGLLERRTEEVWDILEAITEKHPILLNRAPTLHKLGFQGFYPVLIEGSAIQIHPCVCAGYNADFDGDQMAIHIPLSKAAQKETEESMMSVKNLLKPADGTPVTFPNKEMAMGVFYFTSTNEKDETERVFANFEEAITALQNDKLGMRTLMTVRTNGALLETTVGRILFNMILPERLRFINKAVDAKGVKQLITESYKKVGRDETVKLIDDIKTFGFEGATISGLSVSVFDNKISDKKTSIIQKADQQVADIERSFRRGLMTLEEKKRLSNQVWIDTTEELANKTWENFDENNSVKMIIGSGGTRATRDQIKQLAGMRGLVADPTGRIVELPTKSNFREGLTVFEYFTTARGARKGLADKALKTADAGYLTRRLVDVSHDVLVREEDCGTKEGVEIIREDVKTSSLGDRILGRFTARKIVDAKTKKVVVEANTEITEDIVSLIEKADISSVWLRSPLTCETRHGICQHCYGWDLSTREIVSFGTPVGVIAAQSIGEPGTQLTMRTFHLGGIVGLDITQGLPRVEEVFEARTPKVLAPISEIAGKVSLEEIPEGFKVKVKGVGVKPAEEREYFVPATAELLVEEGQLIVAATPLATGHLDIKELLRVKGLRASQTYVVREVQKVYETQGISISDKHVEVIVRKMSDKVRIESPGDTSLLPGELIEKTRFEEENEKILAEGGQPAVAQVTILGITRAALYTESWLSASSFQETTSVLTNACLEGKVDRLLGLKENVIIGRLIPTESDRAHLE